MGNYILENAQIFTLTAKRSLLEFRLMQISMEKNIKYAVNSAQIADVQASYISQEDALRNKFKQENPEPDSEAYQEFRDQMETLENECEIAVQNIRDQMAQAENKLDVQKETLETQLEVVRGEIDEWKEARDDSTSKVGYFNDK